MNSATIKPAYLAQNFIGKIQDESESKLLIAALRLDVFFCLEKEISSMELANIQKWHDRNTELLLNALTSIGYIKKENNTYINLPETNYYLNKKSEMYLGEYILFWHDIKKMENIEFLVKNGPSFCSFSDKNGSDSYDFYKMAKVAKVEMYTGRVQAFIETMGHVFSQYSQIKALDIGGGSGILSIELARNFKNAQAIVFDQPKVISLTEEVIREYEVEDKVGVMSGDFISDDIGQGYNLVIASAIFDFTCDLEAMTKKIYDSMEAGGMMYIDTHMVNDDFTAPSNCIMGWLSSQLDGLNILKSDSEITYAIEQAGFIKYIDGVEHGLTGSVYRK